MPEDTLSERLIHRRLRFGPRRRVRVCLAALVLLALLALPSRAASGWQRFETPSFDVLTNADPAIGGDLVRSLEQLRSLLLQLDPTVEERDAGRTRVFLFDSAESFAEFAFVGMSSVGANPPFLFSHPHGVFAALPATGDDATPRRLVFRQYIRYLLRSSAPHLPDWLLLGFADLYSTLEVEGGRAKVGLPPFEHRQNVPAVPPIELLFEAPDLTVDGTTFVSGINFRWALTHLLLVGDDELRPRVRPWLEAMAAGEPADPAFWEAFGVEPEELRQRLTDYLNQESFRYLTVARSGGPVQVASTPLADAEVSAALGELCVYGSIALSGPAAERGRECARSRLSAALDSVALERSGDGAAVVPGEVEALRSLGILERSEGDLAGAVDLLRRAHSLGDRDPRTGFLLADTLLDRLGTRRPETEEGRADLDLALDLLRTAVEAEPAFAEGWVRLGYGLNLREQSDSEAVEEAVDALERAWNLLPARHDVGFNLLVAYARSGQRPEAYALFDELLWRDAPDATVARSREILYQLDYRAAVRAAHAERIGDAVALFSRVAHGTGSEPLAERARAELEKYATVERHNRFVEGYRGVLALAGGGDLDGALEALEELRSSADSGTRTEVLDALERRLVSP